MGTDHQSVQSVAGKVSCNNTALLLLKYMGSTNK